MDAVIAIGFFIFCAWLIFVVVRFFFRIFAGVFRMGTTPVSPQPGARQPGTGTGTSTTGMQSGVAIDTGMTAEEEGNVHSGPYGYSPNTAYPETQYGSLFNPDTEWNHEEQ